MVSLVCTGKEPGMMPPPLQPGMERLVVVCPNWVGDMVMGTVVFPALRDHLPGTRITALAPLKLARLLDGIPTIDACETFHRKGMFDTGSMTRALRSCRPDAVLLLVNTLRSALCAWRASPVRIGYARYGRSPFLTHPVPSRNDTTWQTTTREYAALVEWALGRELTGAPVLSLGDLDLQETETILAGVDEPYIALCPSSSRERPDKRWPPERFARVADHLHEQTGLSAVACGGPDDGNVISSVIEAARHPIADLPRLGLTLGSLKGVLSRAALVIANDSGPRHVANAFGTPLVSLFGPTDYRRTWTPSAQEIPLRADPFLPEDQVADTHPRACRIDRIPVSDVCTAAMTLLAPGTMDPPS